MIESVVTVIDQNEWKMRYKEENRAQYTVSGLVGNTRDAPRELVPVRKCS